MFKSYQPLKWRGAFRDMRAISIGDISWIQSMNISNIMSYSEIIISIRTIITPPIMPRLGVERSGLQCIFIIGYKYYYFHFYLLLFYIIIICRVEFSIRGMWFRQRSNLCLQFHQHPLHLRRRGNIIIWIAIK